MRKETLGIWKLHLRLKKKGEQMREKIVLDILCPACLITYNSMYNKQTQRVED